jgi:hypothetical protein
VRPIPWSPAAMGDSPDCYDGFFLGIDDSEREPPKQESSGAGLTYRPAIRGVTDGISGAMQFSDKVQGRFGAVLPLPSDCAPDICDCILVILNALSAH